MMLYDVFYKGSAMDSNTSLPKAAGDIRYAKNTNWDGHVKIPVRVGEDYIWQNK